MTRPAPYPLLAAARDEVEQLAGYRQGPTMGPALLIARSVLAVAEALHRLADAQEGIRR